MSSPIARALASLAAALGATPSGSVPYAEAAALFQQADALATEIEDRLLVLAPDYPRYAECGEFSATLPAAQWQRLVEFHRQKLEQDGEFEVIAVDDAACMLCVCSIENGATHWNCGSCLAEIHPRTQH